mgnify:CR=1 FL=1
MAFVQSEQATTQSLMVVELHPLTEVRVFTLNSIWLVRPETYIRMPRVEGDRPETLSIDGKLADNVWHEQGGAWILDSVGNGGWVLRVLPSRRPAGSYGLLSSLIESVTEMLP